MRSDFLAAFQRHPALLDVGSELVSVRPMSPHHVRDAIESPARLAGLELGPGLVEAMLADLGAGADEALPLLAFTFRELFDHFGADGRLELDEYRQLGSLGSAVARVADEIVASRQLTRSEDHDLRHAFLAMVRLTDDDRWVRQVARWDELPSSVHPTLEQFVTARLLVSGGDGDGRTVEVAHEAMFHSWMRLAGWLQEDAEALRLRRDLGRGAETWETGGRAAEDLWRGARLARAAELTRSGDLPLQELDQSFVQASLAAERAEIDRRDRARRRRWRVAMAITAGQSSSPFWPRPRSFERGANRTAPNCRRERVPRSRWPRKPAASSTRTRPWRSPSLPRRIGPRPRHFHKRSVRSWRPGRCSTIVPPSPRARSSSAIPRSWPRR